MRRESAIISNLQRTNVYAQYTIPDWANYGLQLRLYDRRGRHHRVFYIIAEGCEVWYTTDGAMPDIENAVYYDGPFTVEEDSMLIAVAAANGVEPSEPVAVSLRFPSAK